MPELKTGNKGKWLELKLMGYEPRREGDTRHAPPRDEAIELPLHVLPPDTMFEVLETAMEQGILTPEDVDRILRDQGYTCIGQITITTTHTIVKRKP